MMWMPNPVIAACGFLSPYIRSPADGNSPGGGLLRRTGTIEKQIFARLGSKAAGCGPLPGILRTIYRRYRPL